MRPLYLRLLRQESPTCLQTIADTAVGRSLGERALSAIALIGLFFGLPVGNSLADIDRQNAPCPHLIVSSVTEIGAQFAKKPIYDRFFDKPRSDGSLAA